MTLFNDEGLAIKLFHANDDTVMMVMKMIPQIIFTRMQIRIYGCCLSILIAKIFNRIMIISRRRRRIYSLAYISEHRRKLFMHMPRICFYSLYTYPTIFYKILQLIKFEAIHQTVNCIFKALVHIRSGKFRHKLSFNQEMKFFLCRENDFR